MVIEKPRVREEIEIFTDEEILTEKSYSIVLQNDCVTPYPNVSITLIVVFDYTSDMVLAKIAEIEAKGAAPIKRGYTFSEATNKLKEANEFGISHGFCLKFTIEEE